MDKNTFCAFIVGAIAILSFGCGEGTGPDEPSVNVTGTWDAEFTGTVQGTGSPQHDFWVMDLTQSGSTVSGQVGPPGGESSASLAGDVNGNHFTYRATVTLAPGCDATVEADTVVDATGNQFSGSQTQSTCEGTAIGEVTAAKR